MGDRVCEFGIDQSPVDERIALVQGILDSVSKNTEFPSVGVQDQFELKRRLVEYEASPNNVTNWETIKLSSGTQDG